MNDSKSKLISDTLAFLKQEGLLPQKRVELAPLPPVNIQKVERPKVEAPKVSAPVPKVAPPKIPVKKAPHLKEAIAKHLPHIQLLDTVAQMQEVAILIEEEGELPFFQNLKKAIESRFCPVSIFKGDAKLNRPFTLILTRKDRKEPEQILLQPPETYQNNLDEKKALWSTLCLKLSSKSS